MIRRPASGTGRCNDSEPADESLSRTSHQLQPDGYGLGCGANPYGDVRRTPRRVDAEALRHEVTTVLAPMGLRLSEEKTRVVHIDEGFDFLGWRIQRRRRRGQNGKKAVYTYPSKKALASVMAKVRSLTARAKHRTLGDLMSATGMV